MKCSLLLFLCCAALLCLLSGCRQAARPSPFAVDEVPLRRGVNLGNALEAPKGADWGYQIKAEHFRLIREAGFDHVRIPVRFSDYCDPRDHDQLDETFMRKLDTLIRAAVDQGLTVVLDCQHFEEIFSDPAANGGRLIRIWQQLTQRFLSYAPNQIVFDILNEPHDALTNEAWNELMPRVLAAIRELDSRRWVIVGPGNYNNLFELTELQLPADERLIVTFHYYSPYTFTHQGDSYQEGDEHPNHQTFGTEEELAAIHTELQSAAQWAEEHQVPLYMGEFGASRNAPQASRLLWAKTLRSEAEALGFSWAWWEFGYHFGIYDPQQGQWNEPMLEAILGVDSSTVAEPAKN